MAAKAALMAGNGDPSGVETETPAENTPSRERIKLLKVPIDIVPEDRLADAVYELLAAGQGKNIVLLSLWDLLRARRSGEYRTFVLNAALVIPISKSLISGVRFLTGKKAVRYMPFDFAINLLTTLEDRGFSVYLLGGKRRVLQKTEKNIRQTFPRLHIVGRFIGAFKRQEATILEAIRKASPSLLLVGKGVRGGEQWIAKNNTQLNHGLRLWCSDLFDVFAERKKRPSRRTFENGLEWLGYCFQNPFKFFRIFPYLYYKILLVINKLFVK
ncbi:MAG: WecB/TagA/CpsF family glycosyltransferase [Treponema sp.]|jgi:N-acetylglucosaminyldiphosphoundecaprenol N-acetyl-beta-D-mannosaminyltransferase|nr:WecB/TagA/CpsF family glycosyltransferase [Treponema sp.]